ncbi:MAG: hypothetical protein IKI97_00540 [Clostridia bacterium]|nr:hypothetical protein [Clostridia bacterium]MBR4049829.1 hypothetical protein [Clostridia bacterium]
MAKIPNEVTKRLKLLEKLISLGYSTEEDIKKLTPKDIAVIDDISFTDIIEIQQLQESVKSNKLFSYLAKTNEK